ncbi:MAG: endo alpha-1,4 polygalactosaminidase [Ilumatobacter sp.]|uniref:endo alpha-1,4 polygalactosaminidase n=1 Tax=Ilumatobacter sp. TaxID=1967498 RepID=UPI003297D895
MAIAGPVSAALIASSCAGGASPPDAVSVDAVSVGATWQLQLQGDVDTSHDADVYDIDLFDVPVETIDALHTDGRTVICYFSAGSWEQWRDDADGFADDAIGEPLVGWEGERWFDIRHDSVRDGLVARMDLAVTKGCDGVDPDNVTGYDTDTGYDLTADDQLDFNRFLAREAHDRNLLVGLKNDLAQIPELVDDFDFAVNEQCHEFDECGAMQPFLDAGKPVFNVEYLERFVADPDEVCDASRARRIATLILPLALDGDFRIACD